MSQLFSNLIGNALKFVRNDKKPVITVTVEKMDGHSAESGVAFYKIQFTDNGIGILPEYRNQIFNIFQRLHGKLDFNGTGIGLAMCKKIALNHNGDINADGSTLNGAVFNVILPIKRN